MKQLSAPTRFFPSVRDLRRGLWFLMSATVPSSGFGASVPPARIPPGIQASELDPAVRPQDDFWEYVNGRWIRETPIPEDQARWGSFLILREQSRRDVREIIEGLAARKDLAPGSTARKIRDLYHSFMDAARLNRLGLTPVRDELATIDGIADRAGLARWLARGARAGIAGPLAFGVDQDIKHPEAYIVYFSQSGLGLPDRDYYFDKGKQSAVVRRAYRAYVARLWKLAGLPGPDAAAETIYQLEAQLARHQWTRVQNRDREKTYNRLTPGAIEALAPAFAWSEWWAGTGLAGQKHFVVRQPSYLKGWNAVLRKRDLAAWKCYLKFRVLNAAAPYLSDPFFAAHFEFYGRTLQGQKTPRARWKRGVSLVNSTLGELVGREYVKRHFPPAAKARMLELVENLKRALRDSIDQCAWMTAATKTEAREKLALFTTKIGYPNQWRDYSALKIRPDDLIGNLRRAHAFVYRRELNKLGKPIDRAEWFMNPQTVNAYYNPSLNEIVFPAAILQPPFFSLETDDAVNYGGIGAVIGHEMGHGFDDQGRKSDGHGLLRDWWTPRDAAQYQRRVEKLVQQYARYSPLPGQHINGRLTLGENIGDLNGLTLAWRAYHKSLAGKPAPPPIDGLTGDQRFFISFAQIWRNKARPEYLAKQLKTDPHSPPRFRLLGSLANFTPFYEVYHVRPGDRMYRPPEERVELW
jgi:predicted metalloendopeptidase